MAIITTETVEEWRLALLSGTAEERDEATRFLEEAGSHHAVQIRVAAYTALREVDRQLADAKLRDLMETLRRRAEGGTVKGLQWAFNVMFALAGVLLLTVSFTPDVRTLCLLFVIAMVITTKLESEGRKRAAQKELMLAIEALGEQPARELAPLLPEVRRLAAFPNGQVASVRHEASELARRIETVLREEGALPLPADLHRQPERELPRPVTDEALEHLTPNT